MPSRLPYMNVVVPSFNGASTLGRTIESLQYQTYPQDRYQIILVDDCSQDDTLAVAHSYGVRVVALERNVGLSGARNAGLAVARDGVYVAIDDDCIADPKLLAELAKGYESGNPAGVGSYLLPLESGRSLVEQYMDATATGPATVVTQSQKHTVVGRFINYLKQKMVGPATAPMPAKVEVHELYGANGSFPTDVLKAVGGWDVSMSGIEDRDLASRIKQAFPGRPFYAMRDATIWHKPDMTMKQYLLRPYKRGPQNYAFHKRNNLALPIFPFPIFAMLGILVTMAINPLYSIPTAVLLPGLLYFWWPYRMLTEHKLVFGLFPFIQLAEESMVIAGVLRGMMLDIGGRIKRKGAARAI